MRLPTASRADLELVLPPPVIVTLESVEPLTGAPVEGSAFWGYETMDELGS